MICITTFVYEAKISVGSALKTPEAHHWVEALNTEIKQLIDTGTLRAVNLADVPADATIINSTMVLRKKPDKYKARLCASGNELKGQIAENLFTYYWSTDILHCPSDCYH